MKALSSLLDRWRISRALDDGRPLPPGRETRLARDLDSRLRSEAQALCAHMEPRRDLTEAVMAGIRAQASPVDSRVARRTRLRPWVLGFAGAAAAVLAVAVLIPREEPAAREKTRGSSSLALLLDESARLPARLLAATEMERVSLELEAQNLWSDGSRAARGVVEGLPTAVRRRLANGG